jgi:hypothetical protein
LSNESKHYLIEFAARNAHAYLPTFNAFSAIWRLQALISDAEMLLDLRTQAEAKDVRYGNRHSTYEIFDYFAVGFATCLEWHARTRIVDLLHFEPACLETTDVRTIDKVALSQMSAEKVTLPYIVGAGTKVSSIKEYVAVFDRVFEGIGLWIKTEQILRGLPAEQPNWRVSSEGPHTVYDEIGELFETRNKLVHEVGLNVVAHFSLRYVWTPEEAVRVGRAALTAMQAIETIITERTPTDFPNRIDGRGYPEDELEKLVSEIARVEDELTEKIGDQDWGNPKGWKDSLERHRASAASEMEFLGQAGFLRPVRHLDFTRSVKLEYFQNRLSYLKALLLHLHEAIGDNDAAQAIPTTATP